MIFFSIEVATLEFRGTYSIPGLRTLTARGLAGGDLEVLGGKADGALNGEALAAGTLDELSADLLEGLDLAAGEGDTDAVGLL